VARDRKRTRQRRSRPIREGASVPSQNRPVRADLPGALSHSGDVDEFDAALIRGAGGVPVEQQAEPQNGVEPQNGDGALEEPPGELVKAGGRGGRRGGGSQTAEEAFGDDGAAESAPLAHKPSQPIHSRALAFLRASWAELQRVQWPDRRQVTQATTVVLGFVAVAGIYLGIADWAAQKIVNFIL
jgi:preprotein translocase SecE subunit